MEVSLLIAFVGGLLTLFAPCAAMLLPAFFAYAFSSRKVMLSRTLVFALAVVLALLPFGFFAGSLGVFIRDNASIFNTAMGLVVIVLGVMQALAFTFPVPAFASHLLASASPTPGSDSNPSALGVFLLGFGYALAGVGCSGPILGAVLAYGALGGSAWFGLFSMVFFGLGMATPVVLLALLWDSLSVNQRSWLRPRPLKVLGRWTTVMNLVSGVIFVALGAILVFFQGHLEFFALASGEQQIALESSVAAALAAVPAWLFIALFVVLVALFVLRFRESE